MPFSKLLHGIFFSRAFLNYEKKINKREENSCLLALIMNASKPAMIDDVVVTTTIVRNIQKLEMEGCKRLWFHLTAFGGMLNAVFTISNALNDSSIEEVKVISPLRLGATASLLTIIIADEIHVRSNTIVDPFRINAQGEEMQKIKGLIESKVLGKVRSEKLLWEMFFNSNFSISGKMLKDILNNVYLMDEVEKDLDEVSVNFENLAQKTLSQFNASGMIVSKKEVLTIR